MDYKKTINFIDNTGKSKSFLEANDGVRETQKAIVKFSIKLQY